MALETVAIATLATLAAGGVAWVFVYPMLSGERKAAQRMSQVSTSEVAATRKARREDPTAARRNQIEDTLKQLEEREKNARNPPLSAQIRQAGLTISKQQFIIASVVVGVLLAGISALTQQPLLITLGMAFVGGLGLPRWALKFMKKRREKRFTEQFATSVDIIVRGVKAGLPLGDCINIIANEAQEPVKSEFRQIVETCALGVPLHEAVGRLYERVPLPEANFFCIVVAIQQRAGGNLAEVLGNLSRVLRERKKMRAKINAVSMEAKASAAIIGSLPVVVATLVYLTSPRYIELLWITPVGRMLLTGCAVWMAIGITVMKRMISFDF